MKNSSLTMIVCIIAILGVIGLWAYKDSNLFTVTKVKIVSQENKPHVINKDAPKKSQEQTEKEKRMSLAGYSEKRFETGLIVKVPKNWKFEYKPSNGKGLHFIWTLNSDTFFQIIFMKVSKPYIPSENSPEEKEEKFLINEEEVKVYITKVRATNLGGELVIGNQFIFSYKGHLYVIMLSTLPEKFSEFRFIEEGLSKMRWEMP